MIEEILLYWIFLAPVALLVVILLLWRNNKKKIDEVWTSFKEIKSNLATMSMVNPKPKEEPKIQMEYTEEEWETIDKVLKDAKGKRGT